MQKRIASEGFQSQTSDIKGCIIILMKGPGMFCESISRLTSRISITLEKCPGFMLWKIKASGMNKQFICSKNKVGLSHVHRNQIFPLRAILQFMQQVKAEFCWNSFLHSLTDYFVIGLNTSNDLFCLITKYFSDRSLTRNSPLSITFLLYIKG